MNTPVSYSPEEHFKNIGQHLDGLSFDACKDIGLHTSLSFIYEGKGIKIQIGENIFFALSITQLENILFRNIDSIFGEDISEFREHCSESKISLKDNFLFCLISCILDEKNDPFKGYISSKIAYIVEHQKEDKKLDFISNYAWKYILLYPRNSFFGDELSDDIDDIIDVVENFSCKYPDIIEKHFDALKPNEMRILSKLIYRAHSYDKLDSALLFLQGIGHKDYLHRILGRFNSSTNVIHFLITEDITQFRKLMLCVKSCSPDLGLILLEDSRFMKILVDIPYEFLDSLCVNPNGMGYLYNSLFLGKNHIQHILGVDYTIQLFDFLSQIEEFSDPKGSTFGDSKSWCFMEYVVSKLDVDQIKTVITIYSPEEVSIKISNLGETDNLEEVFL